MERCFVLDAIRQFERIEFSPRPPSSTPEPTLKKSRFGKRTSKLTPEAVREIRTAWAAGESTADIAARHGVSKIAVSHVVSRRSWSDVR